MRLLVDEELFIGLLADSLRGGLLVMGEIKVVESRLLKTRITLSCCFCRKDFRNVGEEDFCRSLADLISNANAES